MIHLLYDSNSSQPRKGVVSRYMDDLQWAALFERMVEVIKFVRERGPAYGYTSIISIIYVEIIEVYP